MDRIACLSNVLGHAGNRLGELKRGHLSCSGMACPFVSATNLCAPLLPLPSMTGERRTTYTVAGLCSPFVAGATVGTVAGLGLLSRALAVMATLPLNFASSHVCKTTGNGHATSAPYFPTILTVSSCHAANIRCGLPSPMNLIVVVAVALLNAGLTAREFTFSGVYRLPDLNVGSPSILRLSFPCDSTALPIFAAS